jgi:hypothetical protein
MIGAALMLALSGGVEATTWQDSACSVSSEITAVGFASYGASVPAGYASPIKFQIVSRRFPNMAGYSCQLGVAQAYSVTAEPAGTILGWVPMTFSGTDGSGVKGSAELYVNGLPPGTYTITPHTQDLDPKTFTLTILSNPPPAPAPAPAPPPPPPAPPPPKWKPICRYPGDPRPCLADR